MGVKLTKFYFHDAVQSNWGGGTLPDTGTALSGTPTVTASGAGTNRSMDGTIGLAQTSAALTTSATTLTQSNWFRRFVSAPLAAQTIASQTITLRLAASESNANSDMFENNPGGLFQWRPSTGVSIDSIPFNAANEPGTSQTACTATRSGTVAFTIRDGDVLIYELWSSQAQAMGVAYTNTVFYDGTTEGSTTNNAAHLEFTNPVEMFLLPTNPAVNFQNPAIFMRPDKLPWYRRRSGIFVPDLPRIWTPEPAL